jgi:hypothetical protein
MVRKVKQAKLKSTAIRKSQTAFYTDPVASTVIGHSLGWGPYSKSQCDKNWFSINHKTTILRGGRDLAQGWVQTLSALGSRCAILNFSGPGAGNFWAHNLQAQGPETRKVSQLRPKAGNIWFQSLPAPGPETCKVKCHYCAHCVNKCVDLRQ